MRILPLFLVHFLCLASSEMSVSKKWHWVGKDTSFRFNFLTSCQKYNFFLFYHPLRRSKALLVHVWLIYLPAQPCIMHAAFGKEVLWQRKYDCVVVSHNTPALWVSCTVSYILLTSYSAYCLLFIMDLYQDYDYYCFISM